LEYGGAVAERQRGAGELVEVCPDACVAFPPIAHARLSAQPLAHGVTDVLLCGRVARRIGWIYHGGAVVNWVYP